MKERFLEWVTGLQRLIAGLFYTLDFQVILLQFRTIICGLWSCILIYHIIIIINYNITIILYSKNGCYERTVFIEYWELKLQKSAVESVGCSLSQGTQMIARLAACWLIWKQKQKFIKILSHVCVPPPPPSRMHAHTHSLSLLQLVTRGNYNSFMDLQTLQKKSQSHFTTDRQSASPSWCQASIWDTQPIFLSP
jgi:hypothetical protein